MIEKRLVPQTTRTQIRHLEARIKELEEGIGLIEKKSTPDGQNAYHEINEIAKSLLKDTKHKEE